MNFKKIFFASVIVLSANAAISQDISHGAAIVQIGDDEKDSHTVAINIQEVALLDLEFAAGTSTAITLAGTAPTEAGLPMTFENANNSDIWINYSSILGKKASRSVTVSITDGVVPAGLNLTVLAAGDAGKGAGTMGTAKSSAIILSKTAADIITGVGSAYTGDKSGSGHKLTYQLAYATDAKTDYKSLDLDNSDILTITYTLSEI